MRIFTIILIIIGFHFSLIAQNEAITILENALNKYETEFPKSKTFIKTDKDIYAPGEKVWFKAEVYNCFTENPTSELDLVVMIKAESGEVIVDNKYIIVNGLVLHYITIPSWAPEGNAYLIAYTPKTLKVNEATLSAIKPITINCLKKNDYILTAQIDKKKYSPGDEIKLSLLLQALTPGGKKEKVSISMYDYYKEIITNRITLAINEPSHFKFKVPPDIENGLYFIIQTSGKSNLTQKIPVYTVKDKIKIDFFAEGGMMLSNKIQRIVYRATDPFGNPANVTGDVFDKLGNQTGIGKILKNGVGIINLMPTLNQKYTFKINSDYGKGQTFELPQVVLNGSVITLTKTDETTIQLSISNNGKIIGEDLTLVALAKGKIKMSSDFTAKSKNDFKLSTAELPKGIINFMVIKGNGNILSERLIYNIPNRDIDISIQTHLKKSENNGEVELMIDMNNFIEEFGFCWADIKVVDTQNLYKSQKNIQYNYLEYPLFTSTPKTVLEIFMTNIELIANKYRYFNYIDLLNNVDYQEKETGKTLSGSVLDKSGNLIPNATVMAIHSNNPSINTTHSDENGHFVFDKILKTKDIVVKAVNRSGKKSYNVYLDRSFDETLEELLLIESFWHKDNYDIENTKWYFNLNENHLRMAGSETKNKKPKEPSNSASMLQSGASILDVIRMIKPFTLLNGSEIVFYGTQNSILNQQGALIVIDGQKMGTSITALNNVNPFEVVSVNVSTNPIDIQQYTALNTIGIIEIWTRGSSRDSMNAIEDDNDNDQLIAEFNQSEFPEKVWKYQSTLFWKPNVPVDENGMIKLNLKLSELKTEFKVMVDITTSNGISHQQSTTFSTLPNKIKLEKTSQ